MKFPTTFSWLSAGTLTATLTILTLTQVAGCGSYTLNHFATQPVFAPAAAPGADSPIVKQSGSQEVGQAGSPKIQIAFLLDTSSSMDGLIDQAKARLWNILNEILKAEKDGQTPQIEVALYHYGNTTLLPEKGYIEQLIPLSTDVDAFSEKLFGLKTSGGDEYCGHVVLRATDELAWGNEDGTVKLIYIAGNESFDQGEVQPADALLKATGKGITVHTILCGNPNGSDGPSWRAGARNGKGEFFYINQDEKTVFIPSPYDLEIEKCNLRLNDTYVPIGMKGRAQKENQVRQDANASSYSQANLSSRANYKASANYKNSNWDLVDAFAEEEERVIREKKTLPDSLASLSDDQLKAKIIKLGQERSDLQARIRELTREREIFIAKARQEQPGEHENTLGAKITISVRNRLVREGFKIRD